MAVEKLKFEISQTSTGSAIKDMNESLRKNRKELNATRVGIGEIAGALGEVSPAAGTAATSVGKFGTAFLGGGIVGGLIQSAIFAIGGAIAYFTGRTKEATEAANTYADALRGNVKDAIATARGEYAELAGDISKVEAEAKAALAAMNGEVTSEASFQIHQLHIDALQKITDDMTKEAVAVVNAETALKEANIRASAAVEVATNNHNAAKDALKNAQDRRTAAEEQLASVQSIYADETKRHAALLEERSRLQKAITDVDYLLENGMIDYYKAQEMRKASTVKLAEFEKAHAEEFAHLAELDKQVGASKRELASAETGLAQATRAEAAASASVGVARAESTRKILEAESSLEKAQAAESDAMLARAWAEDDAAEAARAAKEKDAELDKAKEERAKAEKDAAKRAESATVGGGVGGGGGGGGGGGAGGGAGGGEVRLDGGQLSQLTRPRGLDDKTWELLTSGKANVRDWQRYERQKDRERREEYARRKPDMIRISKLMQTPQALWAKSDREFFDTYKARIAPEMSKKMALELVKEGKTHFLTAEKFEKGTKTDKQILAYLEKALGIK